jgi:processive 1,2-diacylglycerol beta-glucosyltransferase
MKGAMLYVDAGKGHYVPAKAASDALLRCGHDCSVEDMFTVLASPFWQWFCKHEWRFLLKHPQLERSFHRLEDNRFNAFLMSMVAARIHVARDFCSWFERTKPDFILCTNFLGGVVITSIVQHKKLNVPVFVYVADVFNNPRAGFHRQIDRLFVPSPLGLQNLLAQGYREEQIKLCPFPLQTSIQVLVRTDKQSARKKLGLEVDRFTVLLNYGGEGIGSTELLEELARRNLPWQVVIVGNLAPQVKQRFLDLGAIHPFLSLHIPGFVSNIGDYMLACDVQAGKAGANALMESMALHRPFMISELLHAAQDTSTFLNGFGVGWVEKHPRRQADILCTLANDTAMQDAMEMRFASLPLSFDSDAFAAMLVQEVFSLDA